jgi:hypothetical protein
MNIGFGDQKAMAWKDGYLDVVLTVRQMFFGEVFHTSRRRCAFALYSRRSLITTRGGCSLITPNYTSLIIGY